MFFVPLTSWIVALIADGIIVSKEKFGGKRARAEYEEACIKHLNNSLNSDIRKIRKEYGLIPAEMAYEQIHRRINIAKKSYPFNFSCKQMSLDLDNQEYIIDLLEACSKWYSKYNYAEAKRKAEWYKRASLEARLIKALYIKQRKDIHAAEAERREKEQAINNIYLVLGLIMFFGFVIYFFSLCAA